MRANGYVIHVTPTIWSIVVESHALRKSWAVTMTVLGVVTKNVKQSVLNLWKKRCHSVDTSKQCHVARTRAECNAENGAIKFYLHALTVVRVVAVNLVPNNAKSTSRERIGHVDMKSPLLAQPIPCGATLECGHQCSGKCGECRMVRVHKRCGLRCDSVLVCSHLCKEPCPMSCPPCSLLCENRCVHAKCKHQCGEACVPCSNKCGWRCVHYKCDRRCGELCNRPRCDKPCKKILKCGSRRYPHPCRGLCGEVCICAVCEKNDGTDAITEIFLGGEDEEDALFIQLPDCKHIFAVSDLDKYL